MSYHFTYTGTDTRAREVGLQFGVPLWCDKLQWRRRGEWTVYPDDHIGRNDGMAMAHAPGQQSVPPTQPFALDDTPIGTNDFRSSKRNFVFGSLTDKDGYGIGIEAVGSQHLRASVDSDFIEVNVNDWFGGVAAVAWGEWWQNYGQGRDIRPDDPNEGVAHNTLEWTHAVVFARVHRTRRRGCRECKPYPQSQNRNEAADRIRIPKNLQRPFLWCASQNYQASNRQLLGAGSRRFPACVCGAGNQPLKNAGFEAATAAESWKVDPSEAKQDFSLTVDQADAKEGKQSLLVAADHPVNLTLRQEVFLPVGTLWRLSGWIKSAAIADSGDSNTGPRIGIEAQAGDQGFSQPLAKSSWSEWQQARVLFRVPSPGRIDVALGRSQ